MKNAARFGLACAMILASGVLAGCSKDENDLIQELTGQWKVVYFIDQGEKIAKSDEITWPDINNGDITALFSAPDNQGNGSISGITVTNHYQGDYSLGENGNIRINSVSGTLINEPDWTRRYRLSSVDRYEFRGSRLLLYYNGGQNTIALERY